MSGAVLPESAVSAPPATVYLDRLSQRDFRRLAEFIHGYSGIKMPPNKMVMVEGRLRRRVRATGAADLAEYCRNLFDKGGLEAEAVHLIDAVTTNKTEFFREPEHFRLLEHTVLPELLAGRTISSRAPLKLWSAACSTGAEPYTLAMVLAEFARGHAALRAAIIATDICTEVLQIAHRGIYPEAMIAPIPEELRQRYLLRAKNANHRVVRIAPELRAMVTFGRLNLMEQRYPLDRDIDVVFCRNMLIYFDKPTQAMVVQRICEHLRSGGFLFVGHSETLAGFDVPLRAVSATLYRRV